MKEGSIIPSTSGQLAHPHYSQSTAGPQSWQRALWMQLHVPLPPNWPYRNSGAMYRAQFRNPPREQSHRPTPLPSPFHQTALFLDLNPNMSPASRSHGSSHICDQACKTPHVMLSSVASYGISFSRTQPPQAFIHADASQGLPAVVDTAQQCPCQSSFPTITTDYDPNHRCLANWLGSASTWAHSAWQTVPHRIHITYHSSRTLRSPQCLPTIPTSSQTSYDKNDNGQYRLHVLHQQAG